MAGMERRTPTRRPAGEHWPGASTASLASALASASRRGMLRRGFAPPGQPAPSGNGASAVLIPHRARRPEVLALLGSRTVPAAPVRTDAACRAAAPCCPLCSTPATVRLWPGHRSRPGWWQGCPWWRSLLAAVHPLAGAAEPEQAREAERRRPKGAQRPPQDQTAGMAAWPLLCSPPRRTSGFSLHITGDSSAGLLLPGRYRSHPPAPGTAGSPAAPPPPAGRSPLLHRADQSRCGAAAGRHGPAG
jgi:hypothetical protein